MVDLYQYLKDKLADDNEIVAVYESMSEGEIIHLATNMRGIEYPCVVVELGDDGSLGLTPAVSEKSVHLIYVLGKWGGVNNDNRAEIMSFAKRKGKEILQLMQADSHAYGEPMYGVNFKNIQYLKSSPGVNAYGYCFVITATEE